MRIEVRATNIQITDDMRRHGERIVRIALSRFSSRIRSASVTLSDVNGPRGGVDVACRIRVCGRTGWTITIADLDQNPQHAIMCAASRAERAVARQIERLHTFGAGRRRHWARQQARGEDRVEPR